MYRVLLAILFLFIPIVCFGANYYLSDTGGAGCSSYPETDYDPTTHTCGSGSDTLYNDTSSAFAVLSGSDNLYIRKGDTIEDDWVLITASGTDADNRITVTTYGSGDKPVLAMTDGTNRSFMMRILNASYWEFIDIKWHGNTDGNSTNPYAVYLNTVTSNSHVSFTNCEFDDVAQGVITIVPNFTDVLIEAPYFSNTPLTSSHWVRTQGGVTINNASDDGSFDQAIQHTGGSLVATNGTFNADWGTGYVIKGDYTDTDLTSATITGWDIDGVTGGSKTYDCIDYNLDGNGQAFTFTAANNSIVAHADGSGDMGIVITMDSTQGGTANIYENEIRNIGEGGIWVINAGTCNIYRNWIENPGKVGSSTSFGIRIGGDLTVGNKIYHNVIINSGVAGIIVGLASPTANLVYNNTIICNEDIASRPNQYCFYLDSDSDDTSDENVYKNNLCSGTEFDFYVWADDTVGDDTGETFSNNLYYGMSSPVWEWQSQTHTTLASWQAESDNVSISNERNGDPNLASDYKGILSGSDANGNGVDLGTDFDDALSHLSSWPDSVATAKQGANWDIGAFLYPLPGAGYLLLEDGA